MESIKSNYIKNTNPELQGQFVEILRRIPHFSGLSEDLLVQLFQYAKFISLEGKARPILEGMYGQEIYTLIRGKLDVFIKTEAEGEKQVDVIYRPFSLFGEQCILGEQNNASIGARGDALLLGIDLSALPDLIDGIEYPENRLQDSAYQQNTALYAIFANVLTERLDRLIKDQYKLMQRITILHDSVAFRSAWQHNSLLVTIFNEFCTNQLPSELALQPLLQKQLAPLMKKSKRLQTLLNTTPVDTQRLYTELTRMRTLGHLSDLNGLLSKIIQKLAKLTRDLDRYSQNQQFQSHEIQMSDSLSDFLNETFDTVTQASILAKPMSKEIFLDLFLQDGTVSPASFAGFLRDEGWISDEFGLAYCMFLICRNCISKELAVNQGIAGAIHYLIALNTPRQFIQSSHMKNTHLAKEVLDLFQVEEEHKVKNDVSEKAAHQESVEDLLSEFGL